MKMTLEKVKQMQALMKDNIGLRPEGDNKTRVLVGMATCGQASGAGKVLDALKRSCEMLGLDNIELISTGCIGLCQYEPIVEVLAPGKEKVTYIQMTSEKAHEVAEKHLQGGKPLGKYTMTCANEESNDDTLPVTALEDTSFYKKQVRVALRNCGVIDPENIDEYIASGGYQGLGKALVEMTPDEVIQVVLDSGIRGRGGAGFPTGQKWKLARNLVQDGGPKYV